MAAQQEAPPQQHGGELIEGPGRYRVFRAQDGSWVIARAGGICDRCENCGCGEQAEPVIIPAMVVSLAMSQGKGRLMGMLKAVSGRG